jgi:hypothetical protein
MMGAVLQALVAIKVISAVAFSAAAAAGAGGTAVLIARRLEKSFFGAMRLVLLAAVALVLLVRGAPHNNPAVYAVFEHYGFVGLLVAVVAVIGFGGLAGGWLAARGQLPGIVSALTEPRRLRWALAGFALLALLAALEQVVRYWDVPGWGDAIFWDRIAHLIARGDLPQGHSYYMPVYQYGAGLLYRLFGHAFAVQQVANVLWAPVTVIALCMAARLVTRDAWVVLIVGALASTQDYLRYTPHVMQIENWYIPILALALWAALRWRVKGGTWAAVGLGALAGLAFETRAQGAFFVTLLLLAPLVLACGLSWRRRIYATAIAVAVFCAVLTPWTIRNGLVDGRWSATGTQGVVHMVVATDSRTFYGIRRDLGGAEVSAEWKVRYPDVGERQRAMASHVINHLFTQPSEVASGAAWRSLAFYGLLPEGVWAAGGPQPTDWRATGKTWLLRNLATLCILLAAGLGLAVRRDRTGLFLLAGVLANMVPVLVVGFTEARLHYPVLCLLFLMTGMGLGGRKDGETLVLVRSPKGRRVLFGAALAGMAGLAAVDIAVDVPLFRPVQEPLLRVGEVPPSDAAASDLTPRLRATGVSGAPAPGLSTGMSVRVTAAMTNHHLPVRWYAETVQGFPVFASDPSQPAYFRGIVVGSDGGYEWGVSSQVAVRLASAVADGILVEDDIAEIEGRVRAIGQSGLIFIDAAYVRRHGRAFSMTGRPRSGRETP